MVSILIPTYNYDVSILVKSIHDQVTLLQTPFEILVIDDCSSEKTPNNESISKLPHTTFLKLKENIGRSAIRNKLATLAKYDWLLFLDADVLPKQSNFISKYISQLPQEPSIVYGGIVYQDDMPEPSQILRWKYGIKREALSVIQRKKNTYLRFLTLNFLIHKNIFDSVSFNENIPNLRHEDTLFSLELEKKEVTIAHIDNPVIHLGLENSQQFLKKSLESVEALSLFMDRSLISPHKVLLSKAYKRIGRLGLKPLFVWGYKRYKRSFETQLLSKNPNLLIFDLYRLCYLCYLEKK